MWRQLRSLVCRARLDRELRLHLDMAAEAYVRAGLSPREARRRALRDFGPLEQHRGEWRQGSAWAC